MNAQQHSKAFYYGAIEALKAAEKETGNRQELYAKISVLLNFISAGYLALDKESKG